MKIPLHHKSEPLSLKALAEFEAHEEERVRRVKKSVHDRTMTKRSYKELTHWLREVFWRITERHLNGVGGTVPVGRKWDW